MFLITVSAPFNRQYSLLCEMVGLDEAATRGRFRLCVLKLRVCWRSFLWPELTSLLRDGAGGVLGLPALRGEPGAGGGGREEDWAGLGERQPPVWVLLRAPFTLLSCSGVINTGVSSEPLLWVIKCKNNSTERWLLNTTRPSQRICCTNMKCVHRYWTTAALTQEDALYLKQIVASHFL